MENKNPFSLALAAYALSATVNTHMSVNSLISLISASFPDVPMSTITLISTLPSIAVVIGSLIFGAMVGKRITYRLTAVTASIVSLVFGPIPIFVHNIAIILFSRFVVGFAAGMFAVRNAYILQTFEGQQRDNVLGIEASVGSVGMVVTGMIAGFLGEISWQSAFWLYLIFIIPLLTSIFLLKDPEYTADTEIPERKEKGSHKIVITGAVWIFFFFLFFASMTVYPLLSGMSSILELRGLGGPAVAATCLSLYTGGGIIAGLLFGPVAGKIGGRWMLLYASALVLVGQTICNVANSLVVIMIGTLIVGWGFGSFIPGVMTRVPGVADPDNIPLSTTLMHTGISGGIFMSSFWLSLSGKITPIGSTPVEKSWWACTISYILLVLICIFWNPDKRSKFRYPGTKNGRCPVHGLQRSKLQQSPGRSPEPHHNGRDGFVTRDTARDIVGPDQIRIPQDDIPAFFVTCQKIDPGGEEEAVGLFFDRHHNAG